jgi:hypothetical protein
MTCRNHHRHHPAVRVGTGLDDRVLSCSGGLSRGWIPGCTQRGAEGVVQRGSLFLDRTRGTLSAATDPAATRPQQRPPLLACPLAWHRHRRGARAFVAHLAACASTCVSRPTRSARSAPSPARYPAPRACSWARQPSAFRSLTRGPVLNARRRQGLAVIAHAGTLAVPCRTAYARGRRPAESLVSGQMPAGGGLRSVRIVSNH